jgi:hypothetical protein
MKRIAIEFICILAIVSADHAALFALTCIRTWGHTW